MHKIAFLAARQTAASSESEVASFDIREECGGIKWGLASWSEVGGEDGGEDMGESAYSSPQKCVLLDDLEGEMSLPHSEGSSILRALSSRSTRTSSDMLSSSTAISMLKRSGKFDELAGWCLRLAVCGIPIQANEARTSVLPLLRRKFGSWTIPERYSVEGLKSVRRSCHG